MLIDVTPPANLAPALAAVVDGGPPLVICILTTRSEEGCAVRVGEGVRALGGLEAREVADGREAGGRHRTLLH